MDPPLDEFVQVAAAVLSERGYLVIGRDDWMPAIELGQIVDRGALFDMPRHFRVVSITDPPGLDRTDRRVSALASRLDLRPPLGSRYYRVLTD